MVVDVPALEERIELKRSEAEQLPRLIVREDTCLMPLDGERFEGRSPRFGALCKVLREMDGGM